MGSAEAQVSATRFSRRGLIAGALATTGVAATALPAEADEGRRPTDAAGFRTKVVLLGTAGGPVWWPRSDRAGISSALVVGDRYYVIDAGEGVGRQLRHAHLGNWRADLAGPLDALRAIFITHMHSDHVTDLNNLLTSGISNGLRQIDQPVQVWGPGNRGELPTLFGTAPPPPVVGPDNPTPGMQEMLDLMVQTYATDYNDRARDARAPVPEQLFSGHDVPIPAEFVDDPNGDPHPRMSPVENFYEDDRVRVSATLVQHAPVFPALAFRFDTDDGSVVFSGDTSPSDNLVELATGADVLVHEVMDLAWAEGLFPEPRDEVAQARLNHLITAHTLIDQVGPVAERAGVRTLVLNHLVPGYVPERRWRQAQRGFSGRLIVGCDLDQIGVGRRSRRDG